MYKININEILEPALHVGNKKDYWKILQSILWGTVEVLQSLWWLPTLLEAFARSVGSSIVARVNTAALWSYICWPVSTNALAIHPGFAFPQSREVNGNRIITCRGCEFCLVPNQWLIDWISIGWDPFWWGLWRIIQVQIFSSESNLVCPLCWRQIECAVWSTQLYWPSNSGTYQVKECTIILYEQRRKK